jgi:hypothetical protein
MSNKYSELLTDPRWQKKRLEILERDKWTCQFCGDIETTLHVHHKEYLRGKKPWEYEDANFQTLCKNCHTITEDSKTHIVIYSIFAVRYSKESVSFFVAAKHIDSGEGVISVYNKAGDSVTLDHVITTEVMKKLIKSIPNE